MNWKLTLISMVAILLVMPVFVSAAKTYTWYPQYQAVQVSGGTEADPVTFQNIYDYFEANPIDSNFRMPREYGNDTTYEITEDNLAEWVLFKSEGDIEKINKSTNSTQGNFSINITKNGTSDIKFGWNTDDAFINADYGNYNYFTATSAEKIKFKIMVSNASINLTNVTIITASNYGLRTNDTVWTFTTGGWTEVEIDIRTEFFRYDAAGYRSVFYAVTDLYFNFTGGVSGDFILIDDLHFFNEDVNPENPAENVYILNTDFYITTWFDDQDFNVILDTLGHSIWSSRGLEFYASAVDIKLGTQIDELDGKGEGGVFHINNHQGGAYDGYHKMKFTALGGGNIYLDSITIQGNINNDMTWTTSKYGTGVSNIVYSGSNITWRNCRVINPVDIQTVAYTGGYLLFKDFYVHGGRYPFWGTNPSTSTIELDGYTALGFASYYWIFQGGTAKGLKAVWDSGDLAANKRIFFTRDHGHTEDKTTRLIDFDYSGVPSLNAQIRTDSQYTAYEIETFFAASVNLQIIDNDGNPINNTNVTFKNVDGSTAFSNVTDGSGLIGEQTLDYIRFNATTTTEDWNVWYGQGAKQDGEIYYPFTIELEHDDYPDKTFVVNITEETDWVINMEANYPWSVDGTIVINEGAVVVHECT